MPKHTGVTIIKATEGAQTRVNLPPEFANRYPPRYQAEIDLGVVNGLKVLRVRLVDPDSRSNMKRYNVIRNSGSAVVSLPRRLLFELSPKVGDVLHTDVDDSSVIISITHSSVVT